MLLEKDILKLRKILESRELTLACAESCTGGQLSAALTKASGASKTFLGSVISYSRQGKNRILGVPNSLLDVMGEVSSPVALEMARGVRRALESDWAIAITGVAGPTGGTVEKPVGYVCFAVVGPGLEHAEAINFGAGDRAEIQEASVQLAVKMLMKALG